MRQKVFVSGYRPIKRVGGTQGFFCATKFFERDPARVGELATVEIKNFSPFLGQGAWF
jgi:hypothetical protein